ncbi:hypothetical protein P7C70_g1317, partial [Phenoliferia sp. Uapishka_3]
LPSFPELLDNYASEDEYGSPGADQSQGARDNDLDSLGAPTPRVDDEENYGGDEPETFEGEEGSDDEGSGYDSELARAINKEMAETSAAQAKADNEEDESGSEGGLFGSETDEDEEDGVEEEDDEETVEMKRRIHLLLEEITDLETKMAEGTQKLAAANNPIFKKRFEDLIKNVTSNRDAKKAQHATAVQALEKRKESQKSAEQAEDVGVASTSAPVVPPQAAPMALDPALFAVDAAPTDRMDES